MGADVDRDPDYGPDDVQNEKCNDPINADPAGSLAGLIVVAGAAVPSPGTAAPASVVAGCPIPRDGRDRDPGPRPQRPPARRGGPDRRRGAVGVERVPDDLILGPEETVTEAQRLLDAGLPFHAHEVLEAAWKAAEPGARELWRGLAQVAVGLTHLQRGNARGAVALLHRGAENVSRWRAGWLGRSRPASPSTTWSAMPRPSRPAWSATAGRGDPGRSAGLACAPDGRVSAGAPPPRAGVPHHREHRAQHRRHPHLGLAAVQGAHRRVGHRVRGARERRGGHARRHPPDHEPRPDQQQPHPAAGERVGQPDANPSRPAFAEP